MTVRTVFDPVVPTDVRGVMLDHSGRLRASYLAPPEVTGRRLVSSEMRQTLGVVGGSFGGVVLFAQFDGALMGLLFVLSLLTLLLATVVAVALPPVRLISGDYRRLRRQRRLEEVFRTYHGRYRLPQEFLPGPPQDLMERAQAAVDTVEGSAVAHDRLLDPTPGGVVLPRQLWEIAVTLSEVSRIAQQLAEATAGIDDGLRDRVIAPQRQNLETTIAAVQAQVEALEHYASLVRAADAAYLAHRNADRLTALDHRSRDLLAETVRHDLARPHIDHLTEPAALLNQALHDTLEAALSAARDLRP